MLPNIGTKEFDEYLVEIGKPNEPKRHKFYGASVEHMKAMGVHMTGDSPKKILDIKRPNEDDEARKYRLNSYRPKTKASASKATSVINRIYNERLFSITFPESPITTLTEKDSLQKYLEKNMPLYVSYMNYQKTVFTKMHLRDSNACVGIVPIDFEKENTEFFEPIPIFYTSKELVDFEDGHYYTILKGEFDHTKIEKVKQEVIIYTETQFLVFSRTKQSENFALTIEYTHDFGIPPCFRVGGIVVNTDPPQLFESFISGVLPHWDDAVAMYSDLQADIVNHIYPEKWEITPECNNKECNGTGKVMRQNAKGDKIEVNCPDCLGTGNKVSKGPFNITQINKDALNPDAPLQIPPFGYGQKELASTELLVALVEKEIKKGFEAINMDILNDVGENQSGVAKVIDRQDLDSFLFTYSSHMFKYVIPNTIFFITMWRYWILFNKDIEKIKEYLPKIKEPTTFDIFSIQLLTEEYSKLSESGVGGTFLLGIQKDIIDKRFTDETTKNFYNTIIDVDPLAHLSLDEMMTQSRVIGPVEQTIHTYAKDLVEEAISKDKDFLSRELMEKKEIIRKLAEAKQPDVIQVEETEEVDEIEDM